MYGVIKFQAPFEKLKEYNDSPEVRLYKAILTQAIIDASNISNNPSSRKEEIDAKNWIFGNGEYFQEICLKAESDPNQIIKLAKEAISLNHRKNAA